MPTSQEILASLTAIANRAIVVAIAWHIVLALVIVALAIGWRPAQRTARALIAVPLGSVAVIALASGNPFNGLMFAAGAVTLLALARLGCTGIVSRAGPLLSAAGLAAIAYGWLYPHFLRAHWSAYLYAAPVGIVPCPTLAVAIGLALLGHGLGARAWSLALALLGVFYGLFGVLGLGVHLDLGLVAAAAILAITALGSRSIAS